MSEAENRIPPAVEKLSAHLVKKKISMRTFAKQAGLWPSRLCKMMNGKVTPTLREACSVSRQIRSMKAEDWLPIE